MLKKIKLPMSRPKFYLVVFCVGCLIGICQSFFLLVRIPAAMLAAFLPGAMLRFSETPWGRLYSLCVYTISLSLYLLGLLASFYFSCEYWPNIEPCNSAYRNSNLFSNVFFGLFFGAVTIIGVVLVSGRTSNQET